ARRFSAVLDGLAEVDARSVLRVSDVLDTLEAPDDCVREPTPSATTTRALPADLEEGLDRARVLSATGQYDRADATLEALGRASPEGVPAELLELHGRVLARLEHTERAQQALVEAAERAGPGELRARALLDQMELALDRERWPSAQDLSVSVGVAIEAAGSPPALVADHLDAQGRLELDGELDPAAAVALHQQALGERERAGADADDRASSVTKLRLANALAEAGRRNRATQLYQEVLAAREREVGPHHPEYARVLFDLGLVALESGDPEAARGRFESALAIERAALGEDSTMAARTEVELAQTLLAVGEPEAAVERARSAWSVQSKLPREHSDRQAGLRALATIELSAGQHEDSLRHHAQLAREYGTEGAPDVLHNLAWLSCQVGRCAEASRWLPPLRRELESLRAGELPDAARLQLRVLELYADQVDALVAESEGELELARRILARTRAEALALPQDDPQVRGQVDALLEESTAVTERLGHRR
ncbi:MAG: tetratricopeptide repeat protein, partial [Myxococcales bacterium]|nr:tetratricopeptide repeat protein [Myxococcales bacterium]